MPTVRGEREATEAGVGTPITDVVESVRAEPYSRFGRKNIPRVRSLCIACIACIARVHATFLAVEVVIAIGREMGQ